MTGKDSTRTRIIECVIKEAQEESIVRIKTTKVAITANTSEANLYRIFKTKENLLIQAFMYIDEKVGIEINQGFDIDQLDSVEEALPYAQKIWFSYLDFFVKHYDYLEYYSSFRKSKLYTLEVAKNQEVNYGEFLKILSFLFTKIDVYQILPYNMLWSFILDSTLLIAKQMAMGEIEYSNRNVNYLFHMIFDGLFFIFNIGQNNGGKNEEN